MSNHDPLCPWLNAPDADTVSPTDCRCFLIHAARADERERIAKAIEKRLNEMHSDWSNPRYEEAVRTARSGGSDE